MKQTRWKAPPKYGGAMGNKRMLRCFSEMAYGLAAIAAAKYPDAARKLERMGDTLSLNAETASRKANIQALTSSIFDDFIFLRDSIIESSSATTVDTALFELNADVTAMNKFLEENITASPLDEFTDRRVAKFISKKESVKSVCRMAEKSLTSAQKKREGLSLDVESVVTQRRVAMRMQQLDSTIATQTDAVVALSSIVDKLELLTDYAKMSPALAKDINRKIRLKPLGDIFYQPVKSKAERDKLNAELYYIIKNIKATLGEEETWSDTLYGRKPDDEAEQVILEVKTNKTKVQKPKTTSEQEVSPIKKSINLLEEQDNV